MIYTARSGDTPESIAADYYGNRSLAIYISDGNGLQRGARIRPGQRVRIPTAFRYRVRHGDTLQGLAQRFLEDRRRAPFLAQLSGQKVSDKLREGQELLIPFLEAHRAAAPESLSSVARVFYGDSSKAKMLAEFNFRSSPMLAKGEKVLVPVSHVRIRAVRLLAPQRSPKAKGVATVPTLTAAPVKEAQEREAELAARVGGELTVAEKAYQDGDYSDVPGQLDKIITVEDPSEAQLAEIFKLKAMAYVALGMDELAVNAFREVIGAQAGAQARRGDGVAEDPRGVRSREKSAGAMKRALALALLLVGCRSRGARAGARGAGAGAALKTEPKEKAAPGRAARCTRARRCAACARAVEASGWGDRDRAVADTREALPETLGNLARFSGVFRTRAGGGGGGARRARIDRTGNRRRCCARSKARARRCSRCPAIASREGVSRRRGARAAGGARRDRPGAGARGGRRRAGDPVLAGLSLGRTI